jgi:hypothetical protein
MPALELRVADALPPASSTRLRTLLETPNAVIIRRNHLAQAGHADDSALHSRLRVSSVLALDITHPPQAHAAAQPIDGEDPEPPPVSDEFAEGFAKGIEIFLADEHHSALILADFDELSSALSLFDAYKRITRYQPAYLRLDQRSIGISYAFREGLLLGIAGDPQQFREHLEGVFDTISALSEADDTRASRFTMRMPHSAIAYLHELLDSATEWLTHNSYKNILGA